MSLRSIIRHFKKRGLRDVTTDKVKSFLEGTKISIEGITIPPTEIISYSEQIVYRGLMCPQCKKRGECLHCLCEYDQSVVTPSYVCSGGKWQEIMPSAEWEAYKEIVGIKFGLV